MVFLALLAAGCQLAGPSAPGPEPGPPPLSAAGATPADQARATELLDRARSAYESGDHAGARAVAEEVVERYPGTTSSSPALLLAARAAFELGDYDAAERMAERYAALFPPEATGRRPAEALIARAREARAARRGPVAAIGVILPQSGPSGLSQYADLILDGVRLAVERAEADGRAAIELVVVDDAGDAERAASLIRELERRGVAGVIGPLLSPSIAAAARSRTDTSLVIVSPTASEMPDRASNVYLLNAADTEGARALAEYAVRVGRRRVALLYPRVPEYERQARAFAAALTRAGGEIVADVPFEAGTTTFSSEVRRVVAARPQAVYIPASERDVRQLAPQLRYFGLDTDAVQVLGGEAWTTEEVRKLVERQYVDGVIATTPLYRPSPEIGWMEFVERYENKHRRTLDNPFPALGHDAAQLLIESVVAAGGRRDRMARSMDQVQTLRGATGVISVRDGGIVRRPFLVRIVGGELEPVGGAPGTTRGPGSGGAP